MLELAELELVPFFNSCFGSTVTAFDVKSTHLFLSVGAAADLI